MIAPTFKARSSSPAIWRPGAPSPSGGEAPSAESPSAPPPPPPPVWTPSSNTTSPQTPRKAYRPVHFEDTPPPRRKFGNSDQNGCTSGSENEGRLRTSQSAPATGLNTLGSTSRLPRAQNPTVTLLQKAREGQIPRGPSNIITERDPRLPRDRPSPPRGDPVHALRKEYASEGEGDRREYERSQKMNDTKKKIEGIGPITKDGMPVALRSEVKDPSRWYKKMYDTIHKNKFDEDYVTIRYKNRRGELQRPSSNRSQYAYFDPRSGYLSEPEGGLRLTTSTWSDAYDSDVTSGPRRRTASVQEERRFDDGSSYLSNNKYSTLASGRARQEVYKNQPGRIEDYVPGKSSVIDKEAKQQNESSTQSQSQPSPKEKKDLTSAILSKSNMARALKESGYESDSTLVFRRREDTDPPLSPAERRAAYRDLQAGGEPPIRGFRSPAPPRTDESEIEYIPISSTLTKIRVHKKTPQLHEVICYPITNVDKNYNDKPGSIMAEHPPIPPRRISSKNSRTLKLITSSRRMSPSPQRKTFEQSNVEFLKDKISSKLKRQNTHVIIKRNPTSTTSQSRAMSTSAPPAINRNKNVMTTTSIKQKATTFSPKSTGTSSFSSPRRTILPINYPNSERKRNGASSSSVIVEGGVGRKTPITSILDKVTSLDKLWSSQKRNERIDLSKIKPKSTIKRTSVLPKDVISKISNPGTSVTHKSRDMMRTAEKLQKMKISSTPTSKSTPCLLKSDNRPVKSNSLQILSNMSKSSSHIPPKAKKQNQVRTAVVTNLKTKKSLESILIKPRIEACNEQSNKKVKNLHKNVNKVPNKKNTYRKELSNLPDEEESCSQFGDILDDTSIFGSKENFHKHDKEIRQARNAIISDSFFQHLFFKKQLIKVSDEHLNQKFMNTVQQKAKLFQSLPETYLNTNSSTNTYLIHRKPVSLSRFKMWDRQLSPMHIQSSRSISWPGKMDGKIRKFDSLIKCDSEFGSTSSLATTRSRSEPPGNKLYFSQTSRPVSPTVVFHKKKQEQILDKGSVSPTKLEHLQTKKISAKSSDLPKKSEELRKYASPTKNIFESVKNGGTSKDSDKIQSTMYFSQTSRPVSPKIIDKRSTSRSISPLSIRSPSYRRIHNARTHSKVESIKKGSRTRSADNVEKEIDQNQMSIRTKSDSNLFTNDPEYDEYIRDIQNTKGRSERFRELNRYYAYLERVAELEKATSSRNLCCRKRDEEIIDFDRWKKIRTIERAEEELNNLYTKLKRAQNEDDVFFYPKDVNDIRWNFNRERGLRAKEKSVEDLKEELQHKNTQDINEIDHYQSKDTYKPLWRGTSVAETAININKKNEEDKGPPKSIKPVIKAQLKQDSLSELRKKIGIGNRLWSSLSMDQVNALKNQLNAIYSKECESKSNKDQEKYTIEVKNSKNELNPALHVRCSSLVTPKTKIHEPELSKSESIAAINYPLTSEKELKNNVNKLQMSLSEIEKKKISQSLSKEILNRINKFDAIPKTQETEKPVANQVSNNRCEERNREVKNIETDTQSQALQIAYSTQKSETLNQSSASEAETGSSDISGQTVIYKGPKKDVQKKVEYFESVKEDKKQLNTIYHANDSSDDKVTSKNVIKVLSSNECKREKNQIFLSQSCANIKELFGEIEKNKFLSLPYKTDLYSRSPSPQSEVYVSDRNTPDTLRFSSDETIWRSRSPSPDPERYWRAYLKLAREGEVRRLARRFDSPSAAGAVLRRFRSDPEIIRNDIKKSWPSSERASRREKCKTLLPVARMPLRPSNRYMPHIDVISKLAALHRRNNTRSRSAEEALECRPGEVERIRRRFEAMSLLGQIYTSAPDVSDLQNIASYLKGPWIAHRYPKPEDNNRPLPDFSTLVRGRITPDKRDKTKKSQDSIKLSSILKSESLAKQAFDPSAHRPASRYEPPRTPPRPPQASWPHRVAPYVTSSRHTVTFQG
ncbi:unnamed protein product, partial [Brenthis ino]